MYRPHLEYACSAWDPRLYKHILEIEKILNAGQLAGLNPQCYIREPGVVTSGDKILAKERSQVTTYIVPKHFIAIVLIDKTTGPRVEIQCRAQRPPVFQISIFIIKTP